MNVSGSPYNVSHCTYSKDASDKPHWPVTEYSFLNDRNNGREQTDMERTKHCVLQGGRLKLVVYCGNQFQDQGNGAMKEHNHEDVDRLKEQRNVRGSR